MGQDNSSLKLICINPDCINKSVVWRKYTSDPECFSCKKCKQPLQKFRKPTFIKQDDKAKRELKEFGG